MLDELGIVAAIEYLINEFQADIPGIELSDENEIHAACCAAGSRDFSHRAGSAKQYPNAQRQPSGGESIFIERGERLHLSVRDWGKGFDAASVSQSRFGLQGIQQRGRLLGAQVTIDSRPGHGTTIELDFPLILDRAAEEAEHGAVIMAGGTLETLLASVKTRTHETASGDGRIGGD